MAPESFMMVETLGQVSSYRIRSLHSSLLFSHFFLLFSLPFPAEEMPGIYIDVCMCVCEEGELISPVLDSADCAESELSMPYFSSPSELAWNLKWHSPQSHLAALTVAYFLLFVVSAFFTVYTLLKLYIYAKILLIQIVVDFICCWFLSSLLLFMIYIYA